MCALYLRVPLGEGEAPASFCSRMAMRNGCTSAMEFCQDMGLAFFDVFNGVETALAKLAALGGAKLADLSAAAIRKLESGYSCAGQALYKPTLRRNRFCICPACIAEDRAQWGQYDDAGPYGRSAWLLSPIRTCRKHGLELVEVVSPEALDQMHPYARHDFSRVLKPALDDLDRWFDAARVRRPTGLEDYLGRRLDGTPPSSEGWLDSMPFYAVARACEMIGAVTVHGPDVVFNALPDDDWRDAGEAGFNFMVAGPPGVVEFLDRLRAMAVWRHNMGPRGLYGQFYNWLKSGTSDTAYDGLRDLVRQSTLQAIAMDPDEEIFDRVVGVRRLHSVHSTSKETGLHPKRLRKLLESAGFIANADRDKTNDAVTFPADARLDEFLTMVREALSLKEAAAYVNAPRVQFRLLVAGKHIVPFVRKGGSIKDFGFDKRDLDRFLERLFSCASDMTEDDAGLVDIPSAKKRAQHPSMDVLNLVLEGRLKRVRRNTAVAGYLSVFVDPEEIRNLVHTKKSDVLSVHQVMRRMGWSRQVIVALANHGVLHSQVIPNPVTHMRQRVISVADLEEFDRKYISLHALAKQRRRHIRIVNADVQAVGPRPILDPAAVKATFYARADIAPD
jgi:hypothetical protein